MGPVRTVSIGCRSIGEGDTDPSDLNLGSGDKPKLPVAG
jgi:hypothetical protein